MDSGRVLEIASPALKDLRATPLWHQHERTTVLNQFCQLLCLPACLYLISHKFARFIWLSSNSRPSTLAHTNVDCTSVCHASHCSSLESPSETLTAASQIRFAPVHAALIDLIDLRRPESAPSHTDRSHATCRPPLLCPAPGSDLISMEQPF